MTMMLGALQLEKARKEREAKRGGREAFERAVNTKE